MLGYKALSFTAVAVLAAESTGCFIEETCTSDLRTAVSGTIVDENGVAVRPDAVTLTVDGITQNCTVGSGRYSCYERGGGLYTLHVTAGSLSATEQLAIENDGCHDLPRQVDLVL